MSERAAGAPPDLVAAIERASTRWPDRVAWRFDLADDAPVGVLTFADVDRLSARYAAGLHAAGVRAGDVVGVMLANGAHFPLAWFGLVRLGAAMVSVNMRYRSADTEHALVLAGATRVVTDAEFLPLLEALAARPETVLASDLAGYDGPTAPVHHASGDDVVNVQMTSGTTGRPKGCVLTHAYWLTLAASMVEEFPRLGADDVMLTAQPFSYVDPQWNAVSALLAGAELVVLDGFHPSTFWSKVREHAVTYFYCLAAMPTLLLRMPPDGADRDHRVRAVQCSAIPPGSHAALERRWGVPWYEAFGMTETGADLRVSEAEHDELVGSGSIGRPTAHREARLAADGELLLRGPGMMRDYHDDAAATSAAFVDGWFRTGDLARTDAQGRFYLVGRTKDMIRRSGENIAAREVEEVLLTHPAVSLAAVVGVRDELRGEEVRAYVVADADAAELAAYCAARLAAFKVPRYWSFHEDLPRTASERVEKARLASLDAHVVDLARTAEESRR